MKKILLPIFLLLVATSFAQSSDKVILVSDTTSVDMLIAKAAGEKAGVPVLVLSGGVLDDDVRNQLTSLSAKTVYLVGGPVVIKPEVETELQAKYTVVRLWGQERTATAVAVARHFWMDGADCVVVADDTKNSDADTAVQTEASEEAAEEKCPFFPVPKGTMPAEVLGALEDLNVTNATFVGPLANPEFRAKLARFRMREIIGSLKEIESGTEAGRKVEKLLVIAAPNWKYVLGKSGSDERHTVVRILNSVDGVPEIVTLVKEKNITDVRVLGEPTLAGQIADQLNASGIVVTKVSGEPGETAIEELKEDIGNWEERRKEALQRELLFRTKLKTMLQERLAKLEERLTYLETDLAGTTDADPEKAAKLQEKIDAAQRRLDAMQTYIDNSNFDTARIQIDKILSEIDSFRWLYKAELRVRIAEELKNEEQGIEATGSSANLGDLESRLAALKEKCNSDAVEKLVENSKTLRTEMDTAINAGEYENAAKLAVELRNTVDRAKFLGIVCERTDKLEQKFEIAVNKTVERNEELKSSSGRG